MGFGGSVHAMIVSLKNNKRKRTTLFEKEIIENNGAYGKFTDTKKMSSLEFKKFQEKLKEERKRSRRKFLIVFSLVLTVVLAVLIYFLFYFKVAF
ncbi:MAG: hypothetical protein NXH73_07985 [Flavobacteriaceae bacterium]|nr:hypothetical protein [Flavobacteriaceae bacterium]